jgi:hypothetical protein
MSGHTRDMDAYLGKDRARVTADVTATHATQTLDEEVEGQLIFVV